MGWMGRAALAIAILLSPLLTTAHLLYTSQVPEPVTGSSATTTIDLLGAIAPSGAIDPQLAATDLDHWAEAALEVLAQQAPEVSITSLEPAIARPGTTLLIGGEVANHSAAALRNATVDLGINWQLFESRSALTAWSIEPARLANWATSAPLPLVAPGATTAFEIELPVDVLALDGGPRGPRELSVALLTAEGEVLTATRSYLLWDPEEAPPSGQVPQTPGTAPRLALLAPLIGPPIDPLLPLSPSEMADLTAPSGRLGQLLTSADLANNAADAWGAMTLVVDPAVPALAANVEDDTVQGWLDGLVARPERGEVYPMPAYDPDVAALAHAGVSVASLRQALHVPVVGEWQVPTDWAGPLLWLPDGGPTDLLTYAAARHADFDTVVATAGLAPEFGPATSLTTVNTGAGQIMAVVADPVLSQVFAAGTDPHRSFVTTDGPTGAPGDAVTSRAPTEVEARQRLLAELEVIATARPAPTMAGIDRTETLVSQPTTPIQIAVAMPRDWRPNPSAVARLISALTDAGAAEFEPLSSLLHARVPAVDRVPPAANRPQAGELNATQVQELDIALRQIAGVAAVTRDPDLVLGEVAPGLLSPLSGAWRLRAEGSPEGAARRLAAVAAASEISTHATGLLTASAAGATMISAAGQLPVAIRNDLPVAALVRVVLHPDDPRLVVDAEPIADVAAGAQQIVYVPVRAIASGDVAVSVELRPVEGTGDPVGTGSEVELRVRAGWETFGTAVVAGVLALLLVSGIVRSVRRGRSPERAVGAAAPDPKIIDPRLP